jgi:hypothetical protein
VVHGLASVGVWAVLGTTGCDLGAASSVGAPASAVASSAAAPAPIGMLSPRRLRRLSAREYDNVVRDLLGDETAPARRFVGDAFQNGYDNGSVGLAVQADQAFDYQSAAEALAATAVTDRLTWLLGSCDAATSGELACAEAFLNRFVPRAYRRSPTVTELDRLRSVYRDASAAAGFAIGIRSVIEAVLQSPQFLYREELGPLEARADAAGAGSVRLTPDEVATELSFLLTGTIPDAALLEAVAQGRFQSGDDYEREARRLLTTSGARGTLRAFLEQWLAIDRLPSLTKNLTFYPTFSPELGQSMAGELDRYFDEVLWSGSGSLRELFTSSASFVDPSLAALYGVAQAAPGFQPVTLDPALRRGVLTRAGFLAVHAATDSSGPVTRGVFVLQSLMCAPPPSPPPNVPPAVPAGDPSLQFSTTRQRFESHAQTAFCSGCHRLIDGVGFGFEQFDGIGAYRTLENGQPVDSSGQLLGTGEIDGPYVGVSELADKLSTSKSLRDCFVRQVYRFAMGQVEAAGDPALGELAADFDAERRMTELLVAIVKNPLFVERRFE